MHECVRLLFEEGDSLGQRGDADCLVTCDCMSSEVPALLERCCLPMPCCLGAVTPGTDAVPLQYLLLVVRYARLAGAALLMRVT